MPRPLFGRRLQVTIGSTDVSAFDQTFDITKSTAREPNTAEVRVLNLSRSTRAALESAETPRLIVRAGYEADGDPPPLLFNGESRLIYSERDGVDIALVIQASDSGRALQTARISRSYAPGTPIVSALRDAVAALGIGPGNLDEFAAAYQARNGASVFADGFVADGPARRVLHSLARAAGLRWSVQNGALQLLRVGEPLQSTAPLLSAASGLVDTPTRSFEGPRHRLKVTAKALLQPGLEPGRRVVLRSDTIEGGFEIRRAIYRGGTAVAEWHATLELAPL